VSSSQEEAPMGRGDSIMTPGERYSVLGKGVAGASTLKPTRPAGSSGPAQSS